MEKEFNLGQWKMKETIIVSLFFAITNIFLAPMNAVAQTPPKKDAVAGPTLENALAADEELAKAIRDNDSPGIMRLLDKDWAVISTNGDVGEGPSIFPDGIKGGHLTRNIFEISEPRVRLFGDVALVTAMVKTSGTFGGKPFDVIERQTDVWRWHDGTWKCILTHETKLPK